LDYLLQKHLFQIEQLGSRNHSSVCGTRELPHHNYYFRIQDSALIVELSAELLGMKLVVDKQAVAVVAEPVVPLVEVLEQVCSLIC
jgi:hypothetical protein